MIIFALFFFHTKKKFITIVTCPVLCSGRGQYLNGECVCNSGWKGKECQIREDECEVSNCNGHGDCIDGTCHCFSGYKGDHCENGLYIRLLNSLLFFLFIFISHSVFWLEEFLFINFFSVFFYYTHSRLS